MLNCRDFVHILSTKGVNFYTGVPDSLLKDFCAYILDNVDASYHIIAANEGNAVALAVGHYLASGAIPLVYMQNSGLGNSINPLVSLVDAEVYRIPILLLIGWRGEPGTKDKPQHIKQGKVTLGLLDTLGIPYRILPAEIKAAEVILEELFNFMHKNSTPAAVVVRRGIFETYASQKKECKPISLILSREEAIKIIINHILPSDIIISTTGHISRELFEYRRHLRQGHNRDFLTAGSMGHSSQIALGIALEKPDRRVYCLDGDGAVIMHMGALATIGVSSPANFMHIVLNNGCHDSVGGQPTAGFKIDFVSIAKACGYRTSLRVSTAEELTAVLKGLQKDKGPHFLEVAVKKGARKDLGRPDIPLQESKQEFMKFLKDNG